ncbi:MAG: hypothetical protein P8J78_12400 [Maricaulis sp.]|jgi:hypothetical protein|nr:hypothetical protein [Maricaulis sp.]MDG2045402.1 hypothetical protein [Maricaulis sp.]
MLLARLRRQLENQNWFAVALEFVIVISGVAIGFQITAWNETRQEHAQEVLILERLRADFAIIESRSAEALDALTTRSETAKAMSQQIQDVPLDPGTEAFASSLGDIIGTSVPTGRSATYVELLASGEMRLVRSEALRTALVQFDEQVRRQELAYNTLSTLVIDNAGILLDIQALDALLGPEGPAAGDIHRAELAAQITSTDFLIAVHMMGTINSINANWHAGTHAQAQAVLAALG